MTQNIAVIAANGKSGQLIVREAVDRGLDVTAVVRGENKNRRPARHHQGSVRPDRSRSRRIRCGRRRVRRMDAGNPPAALRNQNDFGVLVRVGKTPTFMATQACCRLEDSVPRRGWFLEGRRVH